MSGFSADFSGFEQFGKDLEKIAAGIQKNERTAVKLAGNAYKNDVQAIAPYKTGTYRRSIHVEMTQEGLRQVALVGSDAPYGRRLEYGFWGERDSLGRLYYQYPRPHWRPAFDAGKERYGQIMMAALNGTAAPDYVDYGAEKRADVSMFTSQAAGLRPDLTGGI